MSDTEISQDIRYGVISFYNRWSDEKDQTQDMLVLLFCSSVVFLVVFGICALFV